MKFPRFSDRVKNKMKAALDGGLDMNEVWQKRRPSNKKAAA